MTIDTLSQNDAVRISRSKMQKVVSFTFTLCVCLVVVTFAYAETLVVLLEGLGGRVTSSGMVSLQEELSAIPKTIVALPLAQHNWRFPPSMAHEPRSNYDAAVAGRQSVATEISSLPDAVLVRASLISSRRAFFLELRRAR
jgi:hypothetical protein